MNHIPKRPVNQAISMRRSDEEIQGLLARGQLGGPGRDRILERVVDATAKREPRTGGWRAWILGLALCASGTVAVVLIRQPHTDSGGFTAKEGANTGPGLLDLGCVGGSSAACPVGSTLVFSALGAPRVSYLAAYAEPARGGERIWYFSAETESPAIPISTTDTRPAPRGIRIGAEHTPGRYVVRIFLTVAPLTRPALLAATGPEILAQATFPLTVVGL